MASGNGNPFIIGLTGSFGSGCSYVANEILVDAGFEKVSLSEILREEYQSTDRASLDTMNPEERRRTLQTFGDEIRKDKGACYLASKAIAKITASLPAVVTIISSLVRCVYPFRW